MDFTSILKNELFRPVTTLIVPGSIAIAPYIIVANYYVPKVFQFWGEHPSAFVAIVVVVIIATGLVLDNWGAAIEFYVLDRILEEKYPGHQDRWYRYLKLKISDEYVGQRYLRNSLVRMKFELAMAPATLLFWLGIMWVHCKYPIWSAFGLVLFSAFSLILVAYFLFEAYQSAYNLGKERELLLEAATASPAV